jgi:uncharacterized protein YkwD
MGKASKGFGRRRFSAGVEALGARRLLSGGAAGAATQVPPMGSLGLRDAHQAAIATQRELIRESRQMLRQTLFSFAPTSDSPQIGRVLSNHPLRSRSMPGGQAAVRQARPAGPVVRVGSLVVTAPPGPLPLQDLGFIALASPQNAAIVAQAIIDLTNHVRAENGSGLLTASPALMEAASLHSQDMARLDLMAHDIPGVPLSSLTDRAAYVHYNYQLLGENIAYNQADAASVVAAWMNSPPHRQNMLNPAFTDVGVGIAWNSRGEPYYTMMLGQPA